jgi:hypothetical protein
MPRMAGASMTLDDGKSCVASVGAPPSCLWFPLVALSGADLARGRNSQERERQIAKRINFNVF